VKRDKPNKLNLLDKLCCSFQFLISVRRVTCYDHYCVFFNFLAFWPFPWQRQPFWKNQHLKVQLHMAYAIPTRFHKVWSRYLPCTLHKPVTTVIILQSRKEKCQKYWSMKPLENDKKKGTKLLKLWFSSTRHRWQEEFEDTKEVIRIRISKQNRHTMAKRKRTKGQTTI
jgi:hypothetical protein